MKRLSNHLVGVDQGSEIMFSDFEDDGPMWSESGPRERKVTVQFSEEYHKAPSVQVALSMWDINQVSNQRADISAENVTSKSFDLVFRTWGDTKVARVRASWMAIGQLKHADEWDLY